MFALDLFNTVYERALNEGAVDDLEARYIHGLNTKMLDLMDRARSANPEMKAALKREFAKVKADRDSFYKIKEAGIPGSVPTEKIPGKEDLLKGKGRSYYEEGEQDEWSKETPWNKIPKNKTGRPVDPRGEVAHLSDVARREAERKASQDQKKNPKEVAEHGGGIGPKQHWQDLMQERKLVVGDPITVTAANEFEGKTGELADISPSGKFVVVNLYNHGQHSMHLSDIEFNQYAADQEEDDWYDEDLNEFVQFLAPAAMIATTPVRGFAAGLPDNPLDVLPESNNPKLDQLIKMIQAGKITAAGLKDPAVRPRIMQLVQQADPQADIAQLVATYAPATQVKATNVNDLKAQARSGNVMAQLPKTSAGTTTYAQRHATFEGFQDFNKVEPYAVCLAGKPIKKFDYYEQARRFHDNWKQKLYREGNKEKADKITLMPLNLDESTGIHPKLVTVLKQRGYKGPYKLSKLPKWLASLGDVANGDDDIMVTGNDPEYDAWVVYNAYGPYAFGQEMGYQMGTAAKVIKDTVPLDEAGKGTPVPAKDFVKGILKDLKKVNVKEAGDREIDEQGVAEASTDYQKRRQRERDVDAGKPVARQHQSKMTDYQKRRAQDKKDMALGEDQDTSGVERAILNRIMTAHTDLLLKFGPEKVMQAAEEVAYNVGDVDEIGTSDVSAYVQQVKQILGAV